MAESIKSFAIFLLELRGSLKSLAISVVTATLVLFTVADRLLDRLQDHLGEKLYFYAVADPFLAQVQLAFFSALYLLMPYCLYVLWKAVGKPFGVTGTRLRWYAVATGILFYLGSIFCALVTLPFGIRFLLGFQSEELRAMISVDQFVRFITLFVFAFGVIFELPAGMVFTAQVGVASRATYARHRRYAVLIIAILAAMLTPTPDLVNMALMGLPLYLLYESGLVLIRLTGAEKRASDSPGA